jgi:hypothetical protein
MIAAIVVSVAGKKEAHKDIESRKSTDKFLLSVGAKYGANENPDVCAKGTAAIQNDNSRGGSVSLQP